MRAQRLINLLGAALAAVEAVTGDVRGADDAQFGQLDIDPRLFFPDIEHGLQVFTFQQHLAQGGVVHDRAAGGVDQPGARFEGFKAGAVEQVPGRQIAALVQGRVQADDVAAGDDVVEANVVTALCGLTRRVAHQYIPAQAAQHLDQTTTHLPRADHTVGALTELHAFDFSQGQQAAEHVIHHAARIAARCAGPLNARFVEIIEVEVIGADGAGADETHWRAFEQLAGDFGDRAHQQDVGLGHGSAVEGTAGVTTDVAETCEKGVKQWNVFVSNDAHGELPEVSAV